MTNPTDPRIEAAARSFWKEVWDTYTDRQKNARRRIVGDMLKAADEAAWLPIESAPKGVNGISWMQLARVDGEETFTWSGMYCRGKFYAAGVFCSSGEVPFEFRQHEVHPTHWRQDPAGPKP